jgi:hypothetical protein
MTTRTRKNARNDRVTADQAMIDGTNKNKAKLPPTFPLGDQTVTPDDIIKTYESRIATAKAVVVADAQRDAVIKVDNETRAGTRAQTLAYKRLILAMFAELPNVLGDFALKAPKPTPPTVETKAKAVAKSRATRKALGTLGTDQKKAKKAALETAPSTPSQPEPAPAPAGASAAGTKSPS